MTIQVLCNSDFIFDNHYNHNIIASSNILNNNALQNQTFPSSWQDIRVRLLPKKGDLQSLRNWRPISLINCDASW